MDQDKNAETLIENGSVLKKTDKDANSLETDNSPTSTSHDKDTSLKSECEVSGRDDEEESIQLKANNVTEGLNCGNESNGASALDKNENINEEEKTEITSDKLNSEAIAIAIETSGKACVPKISDMDVDEGSRDDNMDVDNLSKDDAMDVDSIEVMDVDSNESGTKSSLSNVEAKQSTTIESKALPNYVKSEETLEFLKLRDGAFGNDKNPDSSLESTTIISKEIHQIDKEADASEGLSIVKDLVEDLISSAVNSSTEIFVQEVSQTSSSLLFVKESTAKEDKSFESQITNLIVQSDITDSAKEKTDDQISSVEIKTTKNIQPESICDKTENSTSRDITAKTNLLINESTNSSFPNSDPEHGAKIEETALKVFIEEYTEVRDEQKLTFDKTITEFENLTKENDEANPKILDVSSEVMPDSTEKSETKMLNDATENSINCVNAFEILETDSSGVKSAQNSQELSQNERIINDNVSEVVESEIAKELLRNSSYNSEEQNPDEKNLEIIPTVTEPESIQHSEKVTDPGSSENEELKDLPDEICNSESVNLEKFEDVLATVDNNKVNSLDDNISQSDSAKTKNLDSERFNKPCLPITIISTSTNNDENKTSSGVENEEIQKLSNETDSGMIDRERQVSSMEIILEEKKNSSTESDQKSVELMDVDEEPNYHKLLEEPMELDEIPNSVTSVIEMKEVKSYVPLEDVEMSVHQENSKLTDDKNLKATIIDNPEKDLASLNISDIEHSQPLGNETSDFHRTTSPSKEKETTIEINTPISEVNEFITGYEIVEAKCSSKTEAGEMQIRQTSETNEGSKDSSAGTTSKSDSEENSAENVGTIEETSLKEMDDLLSKVLDSEENEDGTVEETTRNGPNANPISEILLQSNEATNDSKGRGDFETLANANAKVRDGELSHLIETEKNSEVPKDYLLLTSAETSVIALKKDDENDQVPKSEVLKSERNSIISPSEEKEDILSTGDKEQNNENLELAKQKFLETEGNSTGSVQQERNVEDKDAPGKASERNIFETKVTLTTTDIDIEIPQKVAQEHVSNYDIIKQVIISENIKAKVSDTSEFETNPRIPKVDVANELFSSDLGNPNILEAQHTCEKLTKDSEYPQETVENLVSNKSTDLNAIAENLNSESEIPLKAANKDAGSCHASTYDLNLVPTTDVQIFENVQLTKPITFESKSISTPNSAVEEFSERLLFVNSDLELGANKKLDKGGNLETCTIDLEKPEITECGLYSSFTEDKDSEKGTENLKLQTEATSETSKIETIPEVMSTFINHNQEKEGEKAERNSINMQIEDLKEMKSVDTPNIPDKDEALKETNLNSTIIKSNVNIQKEDVEAIESENDSLTPNTNATNSVETAFLSDSIFIKENDVLQSKGNSETSSSRLSSPKSTIELHSNPITDENKFNEKLGIRKPEVGENKCAFEESNADSVLEIHSISNLNQIESSERIEEVNPDKSIESESLRNSEKDSSVDQKKTSENWRLDESEPVLSSKTTDKPSQDIQEIDSKIVSNQVRSTSMESEEKSNVLESENEKPDVVGIKSSPTEIFSTDIDVSQNLVSKSKNEDLEEMDVSEISTLDTEPSEETINKLNSISISEEDKSNESIQVEAEHILIGTSESHVHSSSIEEKATRDLKESNICLNDGIKSDSIISVKDTDPKDERSDAVTDVSISINVPENVVPETSVIELQKTDHQVQQQNRNPELTSDVEVKGGVLQNLGVIEKENSGNNTEKNYGAIVELETSKEMEVLKSKVSETLEAHQPVEENDTEASTNLISHAIDIQTDKSEQNDLVSTSCEKNAEPDGNTTSEATHITLGRPADNLVTSSEDANIFTGTSECPEDFESSEIVGFGSIVAATTIAPGDFENMESAGDDSERFEEMTSFPSEDSEILDNIPKLSLLAQSVLNSKECVSEPAAVSPKSIKNKIPIRSIKQEKIDLNISIKEELIEEPYDMYIDQACDSVDIKPVVFPSFVSPAKKTSPNKRTRKRSTPRKKNPEKRNVSAQPVPQEKRRKVQETKKPENKPKPLSSKLLLPSTEKATSSAVPKKKPLRKSTSERRSRSKIETKKPPVLPKSSTPSSAKKPQTSLSPKSLAGVKRSALQSKPSALQSRVPFQKEASPPIKKTRRSAILLAQAEPEPPLQVRPLTRSNRISNPESKIPSPNVALRKKTQSTLAAETTKASKKLKVDDSNTEKIDHAINRPADVKTRKLDPPKSKNVAKKSTTTKFIRKIGDIKTVLPQKKRNVAVKRGKPISRLKAQLPREPEPAPICGVFVDTNFGGQNIDMFINENDDDFDVVEDVYQSKDPSRKGDWPIAVYSDSDDDDNYDNESSYPFSERWDLRAGSSRDEFSGLIDGDNRFVKCEVKIQRMPVIDRLLPTKKSPLKLEPNICELCEPKRIFLSKVALADHINEEHISKTLETIVTAPSSEKSSMGININDNESMDYCLSCKKKFNSKSRALAHMKTCKQTLEVPLSHKSNLIENVMGVDLSIIGKSVSITKTKKPTEETEKKDLSSVLKHICEICNRRFLMPTGLASHLKTHKSPKKPEPSKAGKQTLICNICDKTFQFCSELVEHMPFHSLTSEKEKDILATNLNKISSIQIRLERKEIIEPQSSSDVEDISNHFSEDSSDFSDFEKRVPRKVIKPIECTTNKCEECGRLFTIKSVYERHISLMSKTSNIEDPSKCPICDLDIKFRCKLGAHLETHKPRLEEQLTCKKCNKSFRCENNLIRHELEHEGKLRVNCQYCNASFSTMADLYTHQDECKFKCSEYKCNVCRRVFTAKWRLDLHMKTDEKHGTDPQPPNTYFCDQCGREFKHLSVLKRHLDSRCGTEPLFECPDCDKKYFSQGSLASHKRTQHSTEKNFMCQYCSKDFFTKHQLHRHELRHNPDVRPYRCKYPNCDKTYRQPDSLRAHECEHTGLYPYACEFCGVQFSNVKSLKLHRKSSNHWSDIEPNKVVTQACRLRYPSSRKYTEDEQRYSEGKHVSEEEEIDPESHEDEPKNLVINETQYEGVYSSDRVSITPQVPQYSTLQPFTVNHIMQHNQQSPVLVQSAQLATYTQAIENYFVIASNQEPLTGDHHHPMMKLDPLNIEHSENPVEEEESCSDDFYVQTKTIRENGKIVMKIRREKKAFECKTCGVIFNRSNYLEEHEKSHEIAASTTNKRFLERRKRRVPNTSFDLGKVKIEKEDSPEVEIIGERLTLLTKLPAPPLSPPTQTLTSRPKSSKPTARKSVTTISKSINEGRLKILGKQQSQIALRKSTRRK